MRKSTIFMLVYISILFVAPIIGFLYDSKIIAQIALAATISSIFFAIGDLCSNLSDEWKKQIKIGQQELQEAESLCKKLKLAFDQFGKRIDNTIKKLNSPVNKEKMAQIKLNIEKAQKKIQRRYYNKQGKIKFHNTPKRMSKILYIFSALFFSLGITAFLLIYMFPDVIKSFEHRQEVFSIYGCAVVFINYLVTDTAQNRIDKKIKMYRKSISKLKELKIGIEKSIRESEKVDTNTNVSLSTAKSEDQTNG